ncbi:hypothetical protein ACEQ8H_000383 [Pleosporales sp. CAS-2024a]
MLSALTLLLDTKLDENQLELAHVIQESGHVLLQMINDILDYSKLSSGSFSISHNIISVAGIIQSVFRAQVKCNKPGIKLESFLDPRLPKSAEGDSLRYRQIIQNFLSNATKFTEDEYVRIIAKLYKEEGEHFVIMTEVIDSGIGVPLDSSEKLFTPSTQFDDSPTKRYKGTGLGLSICKSLAELMGGNIGHFPNPEGRGTGKRLLLAEDNLINRRVMLRIFSSLGFNSVDVTVDGKEAVAKVGHDPWPYDLILMDINMPVQDGVSATKELRQMGLKIPIVAMTANALKGQADTYMAKGMSAYIAKPVDRNLLLKLLLKCLKQDGEG